MITALIFSAGHQLLVVVRLVGRRLTVVLDPHRWLELRRFRGLYESGVVSLSEIAAETGLNWRTVRKYLSGDAPTTSPQRTA